jgi:hypothetical protein
MLNRRFYHSRRANLSIRGRRDRASGQAGEQLGEALVPETREGVADAAYGTRG